MGYGPEIVVDVNRADGEIEVGVDLIAEPSPLEVVTDAMANSLERVMNEGPDQDNGPDGPDNAHERAQAENGPDNSSELQTLTPSAGIDSARADYTAPGSDADRIDQFVEGIRDGRQALDSEAVARAASGAAGIVAEIESTVNVGKIGVGDASLDAMAEAKQAANARGRKAGEEPEAAEDQVIEEVEIDKDKATGEPVAAPEIDVEIERDQDQPVAAPDAETEVEIERQRPSLGISLEEATRTGPVAVEEVTIERDAAGVDIEDATKIGISIPGQSVEDLAPSAGTDVENPVDIDRATQIGIGINTGVSEGIAPDAEAKQVIEQLGVDEDDPFGGIEIGIGLGPSVGVATNPLGTEAGQSEGVSLEEASRIGIALAPSLEAGAEVEISQPINIPPAQAARGAELKFVFTPDNDVQVDQDGNFTGSGQLTTIYDFGGGFQSSFTEDVKGIRASINVARREEEKGLSLMSA